MASEKSKSTARERFVARTVSFLRFEVAERSLFRASHFNLLLYYYRIFTVRYLRLEGDKIKNVFGPHTRTRILENRYDIDCGHFDYL